MTPHLPIHPCLTAPPSGGGGVLPLSKSLRETSRRSEPLLRLRGDCRGALHGRRKGEGPPRESRTMHTLIFLMFSTRPSLICGQRSAGAYNREAALKRQPRCSGTQRSACDTWNARRSMRLGGAHPRRSPLPFAAFLRLRARRVRTPCHVPTCPKCRVKLANLKYALFLEVGGGGGGGGSKKCRKNEPPFFGLKITNILVFFRF